MAGGATTAVLKARHSTEWGMAPKPSSEQRQEQRRRPSCRRWAVDHPAEPRPKATASTQHAHRTPSLERQRACMLSLAVSVNITNLRSTDDPRCRHRIVPTQGRLARGNTRPDAPREGCGADRALVTPPVGMPDCELRRPMQRIPTRSGWTTVYSSPPSFRKNCCTPHCTYHKTHQ